MNEELQLLRMPDPRTHGREEVRALFEAHLAYHRRREARARVEVGVVAASVVPGISLMWPAAIPRLSRILAFSLWACLLAVLLLARLSERRWRRRMLERASALSEQPGVGTK